MIQLRVVGLVRYTFFFFFNDPATTEIYTLSQHDALPISVEYRRLLARALLDDGYRDLLADPRLCGEDSRAALALPTLQVPRGRCVRTLPALAVDRRIRRLGGHADLAPARRHRRVRRAHRRSPSASCGVTDVAPHRAAARGYIARLLNRPRAGRVSMGNGRGSGRPRCAHSGVVRVGVWLPHCTAEAPRRGGMPRLDW